MCERLYQCASIGEERELIGASCEPCSGGFALLACF